MPASQTQTMKAPDGSVTESLTTSVTYDELGNIVTVKEGGVLKLKYYYDDLNQLIREDNKYLDKSISYTYDLGGNIKSVKEYAYQTGAAISGSPTVTNTYTYGDANWKDKLTAYNSTGITYDAIGNPLQYHNGYSFSWQKGRQLATATNGAHTISYAYNSDGIRTAKTVNGITTKYVLEGSQVVFETNGSTKIWYYYNGAGAPVAFRVGTALYIYRKNLQGDITGIYSREGNLLVSYKYDAWGEKRRSAACGRTSEPFFLTPSNKSTDKGRFVADGGGNK